MQLSISCNALIPLPLSPKLAPQVYSSFLISKILFCSTNLHDFSSAPWLHMVFTTHHDVYFSNYVSEYFRVDILNLQSPPFSFVWRSSITIFWFINHVATMFLTWKLPHQMCFSSPRDVYHTMLFSPMRYAYSGPEHHHSPPAWLHTKLKHRCLDVKSYRPIRPFLHV